MKKETLEELKSKVEERIRSNLEIVKTWRKNGVTYYKTKTGLTRADPKEWAEALNKRFVKHIKRARENAKKS